MKLPAEQQGLAQFEAEQRLARPVLQQPLHGALNSGVLVDFELTTSRHPSSLAWCADKQLASVASKSSGSNPQAAFGGIR